METHLRRFCGSLGLMSDKTGIEWTDATWNPVRGCSRVSEGCRNCYAEGVAYRFSGPGQPYEGLVQVGADGKRRKQWNGVVRFVEDALLQPLRWKRGRRIFVNSMSDLFHEGVTDEMLDRIFAVMALCPQHTFQVLTKRPERVLAYLSDVDRSKLIYSEACEIAGNEWEAGRKQKPTWAHFDKLSGFMFRKDAPWPLPNVWMGVSVENQQAADERLDPLCDLASAGWQTMVSFEPLLSMVNPGPRWLALGNRTWAIVGGESGKGEGIRPMHPDWARSLRDQCQAAGVPFFFKQWGEWTTRGFGGGSMLGTEGHLLSFPFNGSQCIDRSYKRMYRVGKKAAGDLLDGVRHNAFPEGR